MHPLRYKNAQYLNHYCYFFFLSYRLHNYYKYKGCFMQKMLILLLLLFLNTFLSNAQDQTSNRGLISFSKITEGIPLNDPNRNPSWDWTNSTVKHTLYIDQNVIIAKPNVDLPYFSYQGPIASELNTGNVNTRDIKKSDGWVLFMRDFGTPTRAPKMPYFVLYNKYRGLLRFFVYYPGSTTYSFVKARLSNSNATPYNDRTSMICFQSDDNGYQDKFQKDAEIYSFGGRGQMQPNQWFFVDFYIQNYDVSGTKKGFLNFEIFGITEQEVTLNSIGNIDGTITSGSSVFKEAGIQDVFNWGSDTYNKADQRYQGAIKFREKLREWSTSNKPYSSNAATLLNYTKLVPAMAVATSLFESFTAISGIFDGTRVDPTIQAVSLTLDFKTTGSIVYTAPLNSFIFRVPGSGINDDLSPIYNKPTGIVAVSTPHYTYDFTSEDFGDPETGGYTSVTAHFKITKPIELFINYDSGLRLVDSYVMVKHDDYPTAYLQKLSLSEFNNHNEYYSISAYNAQPYIMDGSGVLNLKLVPRIPNPQDTLYIMKKIRYAEGEYVVVPEIEPIKEYTNSPVDNGDKKFLVHQNYPNPFNPTTSIPIQLMEKSFVKIDVYNSIGQLIANLENSTLDIGYLRYDFNGAGLPSGVYLYRVQVNNKIVTNRMTIIK